MRTLEEQMCYCRSTVTVGTIVHLLTKGIRQLYKVKVHVLSLRLKVLVFSAVRTSTGRLFHGLVAATLYVRSPNFKYVLGTRKSDILAVRKTVSTTRL